MLDAERAGPGAISPQLPLTYGSYLRVPDLLSLQVLLGPADAPDEMLFIISQQVQELWFKQILHDLRIAIDKMGAHDLPGALHLFKRINGILRVLCDEVRVLETLPPQEFQRFRNVLSSSSGFESLQFRELEMASGLREPTFLKLIAKHVDLDDLWARWPRSLHDAFLDLLSALSNEPAAAVVEIYNNAAEHGALFLLAEALSEYEVLFNEWRYHHIKLVERTIGDRSMGTAGSAGAGYLGKTLGYRFFPELWEARNLLSSAATRPQ